jgi:hypothetical protein
MAGANMLRNSEIINGIGYLIALRVLFAVGVNVRKTYTSIHNSSQNRRVAGVQKLVIGHSKIRTGKYFFAPFRIDSAMEGAHIVGSFHTAGDPDQMVEVVIAEQNQLDKWADGKSVPVIYSTERTSNAQLDVPMSQVGDYDLGFSNIFSDSDKHVFGDLELRFLTH